MKIAQTSDNGAPATGQVQRSAAEIYDEFFVPALFREWADRVADAAAIGPGMRVLDVACGTGALAEVAAQRTGARGTVVGLDRNPGMLAVARRKAAGIDWREGRAELLPFADGEFDAVACQFGLMFFDDREAALAQMRRVLRPGGRLAVAVWDALERSPGYAAMVALLERLFGERVADALRAPFVLGDAAALGTLFRRAGLGEPRVRTIQGTARFPSLESWVHTDIKGWTLADMIDDAQYARLLGAAKEELAGFVGSGGEVRFASPAHVVLVERQ